MAAVTQVIPNMLGGVSQQPDPIKLPGQVREALNVYLDPTFGCRKRPPTKFIAKLGDDIPTSAKWFNIFRDQTERYVVTCYNDSGSFVVRVWDAVSGVEADVTIDPAADTYFSGADYTKLSHVTLGDYTLIANPGRQVSMGGGSPVEAETAYVSIDQLGYNTTYGIYFTKDGTSTTTKQYRATGLEVTPASYEETDGGLCPAHSTTTHTVSSGSKTGLSFTITNNCSSYLRKVTTYTATELRVVTGNTALPTYRYTYGTLVVELYTQSSLFLFYGTATRQARIISGAVGYGTSTRFTTSQGEVVEVSAATSKTTDAYVSRYTASVLLKNGGVGWRVGDTATVTQGGDSFTVKVTGEAFEYVYASDGSVTYTSPVDTSAGTLSIGTATSTLVTSINGVSGYTADSVGNTIRIRRTDSRSFNISVKGGSLDNAMSVVKGVARDISSLPGQCWEGQTIAVRNTENTGVDDYYVRFVPDSPGIPGSGRWVETVKPGITTSFNETSMPFSLTRQSDGTFDFAPLGPTAALGGWAPREAGDEETNPDPSFVGGSIGNMVFFNNRLGFLSAGTLILSRPGDYFNFFAKSAMAASDADPIDIAVSSSRPATLRSAIPTLRGLLIFSDDAQFLIKSKDARFSAQTLEVSQLSTYPSISGAQPKSVGTSVFYAVEADTYSKIMEMSVASMDDSPVVAEDTRIIPQYIPRGLKWLTSSPANDLIITGDGTTRVYLFKFFNQGNERKVAGWASWSFPGGVALMEGDVDTFYIVQRGDNGTYLSTMELLDDASESGVETTFGNFVPRLDNFITSEDLTPVVSGDSAKLYFPDGAYVGSFTPVFISTAYGSEGVILRPEIESDVTGFYITVPSSLVTDLYSIGLQYSMQVTLPGFYVTLQQRPDVVFPPMVETVYTSLYYSGRYVARVARFGYDPYEVDLTVAAASTYRADEPMVVENATLPIPVFCQGDQVQITIVADDPTPSSITGYSWQGHYNTRGINLIQ